jgi:hypothetical protein
MLFAAYSGGRLYYRLTGGFTEGNITYALPHDPLWDVTPPSPQQLAQLQEILAQPFDYLGKGCQSYVFSSRDDQYVIKFFKYQRFRPQAWLELLSFIPSVESHLRHKRAAKKVKLDAAFASWKLAYEELQPETGIVYVQLNKNALFPSNLEVYDKLGMRHSLPLSQLEFMVQKKASMLCHVLKEYRNADQLAEAKRVIDRLLAMLLSEYQRGYADNDHALMQNTGVYHGQPLHIDVGQFVKNSSVEEPAVYRQELFNKMWKFRRWLRSHYPELADYTDSQLARLIGPEFAAMQPTLNKSAVGRIPHLF